MKKVLFAFIAAISFISTAAFADSPWTYDWAQGVEEVFTEPSPGNSIYLACQPSSTNGDYPITVTVKLGGKLPDDDIYVKFDGVKPFTVYTMEGNLDTTSNVAISTTEAFIDLLGTKNKVSIMFKNGESMTFSLKGAGAGIKECYNYVSTGQ